MEPDLVYVDHGLDRRGLARADPAWLAEAWQAPGARALPMRGLAFAAARDQLATPTIAELEFPRSEEALFLGMRGDTPYFAVECVGAPFEFRELRAFGAKLPSWQAGLAIMARGLAHWRDFARHCLRCAGPLAPAQGGLARRCASCGSLAFARIDPAVIMLIISGEQCLLGRSTRFAPGVYSTLAGFVEAGESLEQAVRREAMEEVGVRVGEVAYVASQPWPFPQSLMLGFRAQALSREIVLDDPEVVDARWFSREELRDPAGRPIVLPSEESIARHLIEGWLDEGA